MKITYCTPNKPNQKTIVKLPLYLVAASIVALKTKGYTIISVK